MRLRFMGGEAMCGLLLGPRDSVLRSNASRWPCGVAFWQDRKADASVGYYGRCLVVTFVAMVFWIQVPL